MREIFKNKFGAKVVYETTQSLQNYSNENELTELLILFLGMGGEFIQRDKELARNTLIKLFSDERNEVSVRMIDHLNSPEAETLFDVNFYERHFSAMTYSRSIDNFVIYFKEILAEVVYKRPEILRSKDQERLDFILDYESMSDLLKAISEKKIEELFYRGINDIERFFKDRLGIELFKDDEFRKIINKLIKQRNLIVHNRGRITKEFHKEFPADGFIEGMYQTFTYLDISRLNLHLHNYLVELDIEIAAKFDLELIKHAKDI